MELSDIDRMNRAYFRQWMEPKVGREFDFGLLRTALAEPDDDYVCPDPDKNPDDLEKQGVLCFELANISVDNLIETIRRNRA